MHPQRKPNSKHRNTASLATKREGKGERDKQSYSTRGQEEQSITQEMGDQAEETGDGGGTVR